MHISYSRTDDNSCMAIKHEIQLDFYLSLYQAEISKAPGFSILHYNMLNMYVVYSLLAVS